MHIELSHFSAAAIFSLFASIVFAITVKDEQKEMVRYGVKCFATFLLGTIAAGWFMAGLHWVAVR
jgi:hypothetical protein